MLWVTGDPVLSTWGRCLRCEQSYISHGSLAQPRNTQPSYTTLRGVAKSSTAQTKESRTLILFAHMYKTTTNPKTTDLTPHLCSAPCRGPGLGGWGWKVV